MRKGPLVRFSPLSICTLINHATRLESEGGADSWDRPRLKPIVEARDKIGAETFSFARLVETDASIVFQQVDIDGSYDNLQAGPQIHIFGVTKVSLVRLVIFFPLICFASRRDTVCLHILRDSCHTFS
jgi:hypothetical protein